MEDKQKKLEPIRHDGKEGDLVVFDHTYKHHDPFLKPLAAFKSATLLRICAISPEKEVRINDLVGRNVYGLVPVNVENPEIIWVNTIEGSHLYPAQEWIDWHLAQDNQREDDYGVAYMMLEEQFKLLKEILSGRGVVIITTEEAERLGLKTDHNAGDGEAQGG
jgi:hypothetical protein